MPKRPWEARCLSPYGPWLGPLFAGCRSNFPGFSKDRMGRWQCCQVLAIWKEEENRVSGRGIVGSSFSRQWHFTLLACNQFITTKGSLLCVLHPWRRTSGAMPLLLRLSAENWSGCPVQAEAPGASAHRLTPYEIEFPVLCLCGRGGRRQQTLAINIQASTCHVLIWLLRHKTTWHRSMSPGPLSPRNASAAPAALLSNCGFHVTASLG